jgi:hypothetical protein
LALAKSSRRIGRHILDLIGAREGFPVSDFAEFKTYYVLAGNLIDELSKEQLAECARLLALHIADYQQRFGDIPRGDLLSLLGTVELTDEQCRLLRDGMQILAGYLGSMRDTQDEEDDAGAVH